MTWVMFSQMVAQDAVTREAILAGTGLVYALEDTTMSSPLPLRDALGVPMDLVRVGGGLTDWFEADVPSSSASYEVRWKSDTNVMIIGSYRGLQEVFFDARDDVQAARVAADQAAARALDALAPSITQIDNHLGGDATGLVDEVAAKADLVSGKLPVAQLPALAITEYLGSVASQTAMLALVGQRGDYCVRTDGTNAGEWRLIADTPATLASWLKISAGPSSGGTFSDTGLVRFVQKVGGVWPTSWDTAGNPSYTGGTADAGVRPTASAAVMVMWCGPDPSPPIVSSGAAGMRDNLDKRLRHP